jgi:hypothetical protein
LGSVGEAAEIGERARGLGRRWSEEPIEHDLGGLGDGNPLEATPRSIAEGTAEAGTA